MRAVRYEGPVKGVVLTRSAPDPSPRPGEAVVRPTRLAVGWTECMCHRLLSSAIGARRATDSCRQESVPVPITLGQHFVGVIESIDAAVETRANLKKGQRVVGSISIVCGECDLCHRGLSSHCRNRVVLGADRDGCFADRFTLPLANLHAVPPRLDDDHAVFAVMLAAAVQAAKQLRVEGKPYITVLGDGRVGLLCAQLMNRLNASVRVVGRHEDRAELASKWGIRHRLEGVVGRRADQDIVVDCTGTPAGFDLAAQLVRPRGKILVKGPPCHRFLSSGIGAASSPSAFSLVAEKEIEVIGSRCGPVGEALQILGRGEVDVVSLISKRARLDDAPAAVRAAAETDLLTVLLEP